MLWSEFRTSVRGLIRTPWLSGAAILALALGIGPNTAIFSIVYAALFAPLPYTNPEELVRLTAMAGNAPDRASVAEYLEWKRRATSFQKVEAFWPGRTLNLATDDAPEVVITRQVTTGGHSMLSDRMWLGRDFRPDEDQPGKQHVVILTNRLWRNRFGADRGIIGRDVRMDSIPYTVIGVFEPGDWDRAPANVWIPISFTPANIANRQLRPLIVDARLKPGVTMEQAQQEMNVIAADLAREFPDSNVGRTVRVVPLDTAILNSSRTMVAGTTLQPLLWSLLAAVSFVVLMACVNVANLLLSRGVTKERETAIRAALGATRGRLVRLALMEGVVLAAIGGVLGVLASVWILQGILAMLPPFTLASTVDPKLNVPVLSFALGVTMFAGALSGSVQAWQGARTNVNDTLKQAGRSEIARGRRRLLHALVVVEFALAVTLLGGAGLTILSFWNRTQVDLGVRADHIMTFGLPMNQNRFSSAEQVNGFYRQLLEKLQAVPGVTKASVSSGLPLLGFGAPRKFTIVGRPEQDGALRPSVGGQAVSPEYFETFGIRMLQGRALNDHDGPTAQRVTVVNERFVRLFLDGLDPVGQRVVMDGDTPGSRVEWHVVGVFRDVSNVEQFGEPKAPQLYVPFAQNPSPRASLAVRTTTDPEFLRASLAAAVHALEPTVPLTSIQTMEQIVSQRLAPDRFNIMLYGGLAALALLLAAIGIYGVMAFTVMQRTAEIGLRMALGAGHNQVRFQMLREGATLATIGLVLGLVGAYALGRTMQTMLFGTGALNVPVVVATGLVLLGTALAACYLPARRASVVDPLIALRQL